MQKTGRNDPCPCGSGRKYKQCCLQRESSRAAQPQSVEASLQSAVQVALAHHRAGELPEAEAIYRRILRIAPNHADALHFLGLIANQAGDNDTAVELIGKALEIDPDYAEAHGNLGLALREQGKLDEAAAHYRKALAIMPGLAEANCNLGELYVDRGDFPAARSYLDRALALEPDHPAAWAALAGLRKMTAGDAEWAQKAQRLLDGKLQHRHEMALSYALGKYYDDTGQYDAAFARYADANRLKRQLAGALDREKCRQMTDDLIAAYTPEAVQRQRAGASQSARPLFIVGMPRSGTSLTEQILASHLDVFGAGELRFWGELWKEHGGANGAELNDERLQDAAARYEAELQRHSATALRVVDKMPENFKHLGLIHAAFPNARILHTRRNPIDTCLSIYFQNFNNRLNYAADLDDLAFYYREYHRLMAHWRAVLPPEVFMDVPYESLVEDQEGWSRRIIEFTGLEWDERCLSFHETERRVGTASNWQVRQKIYKTSKERWRNYERHLGPLLPLLELE